MSALYKIYVCVVLEKDGKILLSKRQNTGWMDGFWHIPGGGLEENESLTHAAAREANEELGIAVDPAHLCLMHVLHLNKQTLGFYFKATLWQGEPINNEPAECSQVDWFAMDDLPEEMSPFARRVIESNKTGSQCFFIRE
ncbi:NUDIX hydrolase [soil metagenome]